MLTPTERQKRSRTADLQAVLDRSKLMTGQLWVSTTEVVLYFEAGRFVRVSGIPGGLMSSAMAGDGRGNVWVLDGVQGLFYCSPKGAIQRIPLSQFGDWSARALGPDRVQGGAWLGFFQGGITYFQNGQARTSYSTADGLGAGLVNDLRFVARGALWAATESELSRIKDQHVATLTSTNGLPCNEVHWSIEDADHAVWLYLPCGLVRITPSELDAG